MLVSIDFCPSDKKNGIFVLLIKKMEFFSSFFRISFSFRNLSLSENPLH